MRRVSSRRSASDPACLLRIAFQSIRDALAADHRRIGALLARAREGDFSRYEELRGALLRHIGMEEKILLPAVRSAGRLSPDTVQLRLDHSAIVAMLVPSPSTSLVERLIALLEIHDALEEGPTGIYALADEVLPDPGSVLARFERAPVPPLAPHFDGPRAHAAIETLAARAADARRAR